MISNQKYILDFREIGHTDHDRVGGKCASLGEMTRAGVAVPPGFAVTTDAYGAFLELNGLGEKIAVSLAGMDPADLVAVESVSAQIRALILQSHLPLEIDQAIRAAYCQMGENLPVAIRSSATAEDLPDASFAGQQDTFLWIHGADNVVKKVRECWASLFASRAVSYRQENNIPQDVLMSVAVQKMVNSRASGVAMSIDPTNGDRTKIVIDASWGLGETVVSGEVTPDHFRVEKVLLTILERKISDKHIELVGDPVLGQAVEREITGERRTQSSLTDVEITAVAVLVKLLEQQNKCPQDVEWAFDADLPDGQNLLALQSRPETVWSQKSKSGPTTTKYATGVMGIVGAFKNPTISKT